MRIAVVFPGELTDDHLHKDIGLIARGLAEAGHDVTLVCHESHVSSAPFPIRHGRSDDFVRQEFWSDMNLAAAVVYTWIRGYAEVLDTLNRAGVFTISKGDTDGQLGIRVYPHAEFVFMVSRQPSPAKKISETARWLRRYLFNYAAENARTVKLLKSADTTVVETEGARANLIHFLDHYGVEGLHSKIHVIPNPVSEDILKTDVPGNKVIKFVCIGRWDDPQKDAALLTRVLRLYTKKHPTVQVAIIGDGGKRWFQPLAARFSGIQCTGAISHEQITEHLAESQVCLFASKWEGSPISANEALAMGCSLAGPDLPFLRGICAAGRFGSMAKGRQPWQIVAALEREMLAWEQQERSAQEIAGFWRPILSPQQIARQYVALVQNRER